MTKLIFGCEAGRQRRRGQGQAVGAAGSGAAGGVVIAKRGKPVAALSPIEPAKTRKLRLIDMEIPDSFFEPLPEEELEAWEGR